jgi:hypothetical protein
VVIILLSWRSDTPQAALVQCVPEPERLIPPAKGAALAMATAFAEHVFQNDPTL